MLSVFFVVKLAKNYFILRFWATEKMRRFSVFRDTKNEYKASTFVEMFIYLVFCVIHVRIAILFKFTLIIQLSVASLTSFLPQPSHEYGM